MATKSVVQSVAPACRHLGLATDPFQHAEGPTEEHRCYLWMQRDLIDQDHQRNYCLSSHHADCPWLQISMPCKSARGGGSAGEGLARVLEDSGRRAGRAIAAFSMIVAAQAWVLLRALAVRIWANTPVAMARAWRALAPGAGGALRGIGRGGLRSGNAILQFPGKRRTLSKAKAGPAEDFPMLMRLGRAANKSGRRKEAHLCFSRAVALDGASEEAWLWMAATADDPAEAQGCLEKALAINPDSGRGRAQLAGLSKPAVPARQNDVEVLEEGISASVLVDQGLKAMDEGNEDRAHHLFAAATDSDRSSETAWFWRAKTATDLAEVITCLRRVLELNPDNQKAQASLRWATDRQRADGDRQRMLNARSQGPIARTSYTKPEPPPPPAILHVASLGYMLLGLLWTAPAVLLLLDDGVASQYRKIGLLPLLNLPYWSSSIPGLTEGLVPEFNLFYAVPVVLAFLCFVAMETLSAPGRINSLYVALVTGASAAAAGFFVARQPALGTLLVLSIVNGGAVLAGRLIHGRRLRRQTSGDSAGALENAQLVGAGQSKAVRV
ncbi:MAG: tetratricopeptide repeat protein [Dehalococcoidia bacterium]|nr:tetratricopeptide repeat protein [Dehalococcoidia bacterium]